MKVFFLLMFVSVIQVCALTVYSQNEKISIHLENKSVRDALEYIESQSVYRFFFNESLIDVNRKVTIDSDETPIVDILKELFLGTDVETELKGSVIILSNQKTLNIGNKQTPGTVKGIVTDKKGAPIPGVTIIVKGTAIGTITDAEGKFMLTDLTADNILVFSFIGMLPKELEIGTQETVNVILEEDVVGLDEVVVIGYGTIQKKDLTGSIVSIKTDDLGTQPVSSIGEAIQGRAAGVQVISAGEPGSNVTFRIRGTGTINTNDPLIVVDGIPLNGGINQVNMTDIESVQVLKDASASAIYGSRGANGVVILTTKRGKEGKSQINFDYFYALQSATNMVKQLNASEYAQLHNEILANGGLSGNPDFTDPTSLGAGTNWLDELFTVAPMQNYSLSYSGGTEKTKMYVSGNILNQEGIVEKTGFKRYMLQFNSDTKINSKLKFGTSIKLEYDLKTKGDYSIRNAMLASPAQPVFREDGDYSGTIQQPLYDGDITNPIGKANVVETSIKGYNTHGSIYGEYEILEGLKFKSNAGLETNFWDGRTWAPKYSWDSQVQENSYLYQSSNKSITWLWDNTLTYDKVFADVHRIKALIGTSAQENHFEYMDGSIQKFASDLTQQLANGTLQPTINGNASEWALMSYMGRLNYVYNDKYYLTATVRRDGSSRFGENNKWGTFPSVSAAWRISNEEFFKGIRFVSDFKVRAGYGLTGNQDIGNYTFASVLNTIKYNFNGNYVSTVVPNRMPNPNVHWEAQEQFNLGFDASIIQNRINLIFDAYVKNTNDMLVPMAVPITTGYSDINVPYINAGKIQNKGIEFTVSSINIDGDFKWGTDFTFSINSNEVVSINDTIPMSVGSIGLNYNLALLEAGQPINVFYGFVTDGIFQTQEEVDNHAVQTPGNDPFNRTSPGDIRFKDLNNDGVINDSDRTYIGNPNPKLIFSLNNTFSYRNFDLSIFLQGVWGNEIFNANRLYTEAMAVSQNQSKETLYRWTGEGTSNEMPRAMYNDPNKNTRPSNRYVENGSYLRIKNLSFGYKLPTKIAQKVKLESARVYVSGQNLWTYTKYQGFDPEVSVNGIDNNLYPITRTISFGINLGF